MVARKFDRERAAEAFPWLNTQHIRYEIEHMCPTYKGIADLRKKGDQFQYGGPRLLVDRFQTPDGLGHFSAVALPEERVPSPRQANPGRAGDPGQGRLMLATRRGKQFNSIIFADEDPLNGAARDEVLISAEDAARMGLNNGDEITLRNEHGSLTGRVRIDRVKPGCLLANWPEANAVLPAGRLDASGVPDYNAMVEIVRGHSLQTRDVPAGGDIAA
jgi:anaerobic selenocysteine-containing dehydrogenase